MKLFLIPVFALFIFNAKADIEHVVGDDDQPTPLEITKNRACFEEVAKQGCGDPGEDQKHFRTCLHDAFPILTDDCRKMMSGLYSTKK